MKMSRKPTALEKKARRGFRGYPVATIAFYGPDADRASKVAVGIIMRENEPCEEMLRWKSPTTDVRYDRSIGQEILRYIKEHDVQSVVAADRIIGCPHEEGVDYPDGELCPECPYWAERDRWSGELLPTQ
jgi:hypothetical protein